MKKAVFITGAQTGTGYGIAEKFAKEGYDVFITSRRGAEAERAAEQLSKDYGIFSKGYECNIGNEQQIIDIFMNSYIEITRQCILFYLDLMKVKRNK